MKISTLIFFVYLTNILFGQQKKYDTLFIANKKYLLEVERPYKTNPYDFPFAIAERTHKDLYTQKYYNSVDEYTCIDGAEFTPSGIEIIVYKCKDYKTRKYLLNNFVDSVAMSLDDFGKIYIKTSNDKYFIEKIQFKLVFDSTLRIVNPDINQNNESFSLQLREAIYKENPKFIILNEMLYIDKKGNLKFIPRQFIISLK